jgi:hypothetical protein
MNPASFAVLYPLSITKHMGLHNLLRSSSTTGHALLRNVRFETSASSWWAFKVHDRKVQQLPDRVKSSQYSLETSAAARRGCKWTTCSRLLSLSPIRIIRSPATYVSNYPRAGLCFLVLGFVASKFRGLATSRSTYHSPCHTLAQAHFAVNFPKRPTQLSSLVI